LHLREASCDFRQWAVEILFEEQRPDMFLDTGWEDFARVHNL
jgi:hypothetical protein